MSDEIDGIRERLAEFDERERASQESVLDDIEEDVVALRAHLTGDADRRAEGIRNQIQQYRQTPSDESETLSLADATLLDADGIPIDVAADDGGVATLNGTLLNGGEPREVVVVLTLYARDETPIKTIETRTFALDSDEQRTIEHQLHAPEDAASYGVAVFEAADTRALPNDRSS